MTKAHRKLVDQIFTEALDRAEPERVAFILAECGDDEKLRDEILALLRGSNAQFHVENQLSNVRSRVLHSVFDDDVDASEDLSGQVIGPWRIEKPIARGGLSTVYLAHRDDGEFAQTAVLKALRRGLDTDDLIGRFRTERQILSTLEHPSIAQILDGGALADGRPFLVLEYVDGSPITNYCIEKRLSVRERVILMIEVLRALHHAHQHLVVHRDVKPSNILVTTDGNVSLLDFGIAKLLDTTSIPGERMLTRTGMSLLTPGYGSPEQHAGVAVTTASDIYQAGLVLFEMLTGERPFKDRDSPKKGHTEPLLASRRLRNKPEFKEVRGDLDAIIRMATRGDPEQRYASADEMVTDLQRYLDGLPVRAQPDSFGYRISKLTQRYRWLIPAVAVGTLSLIGYVGALTAHNEQLEIERNRATEAQEFLVDLLGSADPFAPADDERGSDITVVEALDIGVERLQSGQYEDETLKESLLTSIASVYQSLDQHQKGIDLREESLKLQRKLFGETSDAVLASLRVLANEYKTIGNYPRAEALFDEQLTLARLRYTNGEPDLGVAEAVAGAFQLQLGNDELGERLLRDGVEKMRRDARQFARQLINAEVKLASTRLGIMREETLELLARTQQLAESEFAADGLSAALVHAQTATSLSSYGEYTEAEARFNLAIEIYEARLGRRHGATLAALSNLGSLYTRTGRFEPAENIYRELLETYLQKYGPKHRGVALSYQNLAIAIGRQERLAESIALHRKAHQTYQSMLNENNPTIGLPLLSIAAAELKLGNSANALGAAQEALALFRKSEPDSNLEGIASCLVGLSLQAEGVVDDGMAMILEARKTLKADAIPPQYANLCLETTPQ